MTLKAARHFAPYSHYSPASYFDKGVSNGTNIDNGPSKMKLNSDFQKQILAIFANLPERDKRLVNKNRTSEKLLASVKRNFPLCGIIDIRTALKSQWIE